MYPLIFFVAWLRMTSQPTKRELEMPRSAKDFLSYVEGKIRNISINKADVWDYRLRKNRFYKALAEEMLPLGRFCKHYFRSSRRVTIKYKIGNQPYDAEVTDNRPNKSSIKYIEITQAHKGEIEYLRMLVMRKLGWVGLNDHIQKIPVNRKIFILVVQRGEAEAPLELLKK